jgi:hypothetical protein
MSEPNHRRQSGELPFPRSLLLIPLAVLVCLTGLALAVSSTGANAGAAPVPRFTLSPLAVHPLREASPRAASPAPESDPRPAPVSPLASTVAGAATVVPARTGCAAALDYLSANSAPGFQLVCPGYADGAQALTCVDEAPCAPGQRMIVIADPCPAAYMNEAHNSWVLLYESLGKAIPPGGVATIDPYGHC